MVYEGFLSDVPAKAAADAPPDDKLYTRVVVIKDGDRGPTQRVMDNASLRRQFLERALSEHQSWEERWRSSPFGKRGEHYKELASIFEAARKTRKRLKF